ncbi:MAG: hypothetical protein ACEQSR_12895, partial [Candidatus Methylacidiphilales bacterium]
MIFYKDLFNLQQYKLCRNEACYCEPVYFPNDVIFQIPLPDQISNNYIPTIGLYSEDGTTLLADITGDFDILFAIDIYGKRYANFRLKTFSQFIFDCFVLKVVIKNENGTIFNHYSEKYCRKYAQENCVISIPDDEFELGLTFGYFINGVAYTGPFEFSNGKIIIHLDSCNDVFTIGDAGGLCLNGLELCLDGVEVCLGNENSQITFEKITYLDLTPTGCAFPYLKVCAEFDCYDNIGEKYYGDPHTLLNFANNVPTLRYSNCMYIPAKVERLATDIKTSISKYGKVTRSEYQPTYQLIGLDVFPYWKQNEIENLFTGKEVLIDGDSFTPTGGAVLEKDTIPCSCSYLLKTKLSKKNRVNNLNCTTDCSIYCTYFVVAEGNKNQPYYKENGDYIGSLFTDLLAYLNTFGNATEYTTVTPCEISFIIKLNGTGYLPSYFYTQYVSQQTKVFGIKDDCENPTKICDGQPLCAAPIIILPPPIEDVCPGPT